MSEPSMVGKPDPRLDAWWRLIHDDSHPELAVPGPDWQVEQEDRRRDPVTRCREPVTRCGFAKGSQAWNDALAIGETPLELTLEAEQQDLFSGPAATLYWLDEDKLMLPRSFGGNTPADSATQDTDIEHRTAITWDEQRVVFACLRGWCSIERTHWESGARSCPGC